MALPVTVGVVAKARAATNHIESCTVKAVNDHAIYVELLSGAVRVVFSGIESTCPMGRRALYLCSCPPNQFFFFFEWVETSLSIPYCNVSLQYHTNTLKPSLVQLAPNKLLLRSTTTI